MWAIHATKASDASLALYCLANHWLVPAYSELDYDIHFDKVGFRLLRFFMVRARGIDLPINFTVNSDDFRQIASTVAVRKEIEELLSAQAGLACLDIQTKKYLLSATRLNAEAWQSAYLSKNLQYVKQYIDRYCNDPHSDGERQFAELARSLRTSANWTGFFAQLNSNLADIYDYLRTANGLINRGRYADALYVLAKLYTLPEIAAEERREFTIARILVRRCIRMMRRDRFINVGYEEALVKMAGLSWQDDNRVSHEAVCPLCFQGNRFGSGRYDVELRAYFNGAPARSIDRKLDRLAITCHGACTSTVLVREGECAEGWTQREVRAYLLGLGSPLADHFEGVDLAQLRMMDDED